MTPTSVAAELRQVEMLLERLGNLRHTLLWAAATLDKLAPEMAPTPVGYTYEIDGVMMDSIYHEQREAEIMTAEHRAAGRSAEVIPLYERPSNETKSPPVIVAWAVGDLLDNPAIYNIRQFDEASDAARRWNKPITGLVQAPHTPTFAPRPAQETKPPLTRCVCGEQWSQFPDWTKIETATSVHYRDQPCHQKAVAPIPPCVFRTGCQSPEACKQAGQCESDFAKNLRKAASEKVSTPRCNCKVMAGMASFHEPDCNVMRSENG